MAYRRDGVRLAAGNRRRWRRGFVLICGQFKNMFITPLYRQYASHTLASWAYGPQPHMRSSPMAQDHT